jgi:hypothetical protein
MYSTQPKLWLPLEDLGFTKGEDVTLRRLASQRQISNVPQ